MDGYSLTNKMRQARRRYRLTAVEQALFYELVAVCNGEDWSEVFDCSNVELCQALNINKNTLIKARERLINAGLVYYLSGKSKRSVSSYSFTVPFVKQEKRGLKNKPKSGTDSSTVGRIDAGMKSRHLNKPEKETKKEENRIKKTDKPQGYEKYDFSFLDEEMKDCFWDWLEYKRQRGQKYKSQRSLELCFKKLNDLCNGDKRMAQQIIEQSQANNWSGLFELKTNKKSNHEYKHPLTGRTTKTEYRDF